MEIPITKIMAQLDSDPDENFFDELDNYTDSMSDFEDK